MNEDLENRADMNTGKKWSQMDLLDLANCIRLNDPVEEIASFVCRSRREIREKIAELGRSGELPGLIEKAAAEAVDETEDDNETQDENSYIVAEPQRPH
jgi:hypothetical protein